MPVTIAIRGYSARAAQSFGGVAGEMTLTAIWVEVRSALLAGGQVIGMGLLIEIADQIRWNGLPAAERNLCDPVRTGLSGLWRWLVAPALRER